MAAAQSFGQALPDQVDRIAALSDAQLGLLTDVREIYKDRAALEKEYAGKLSVLAKKAADKKAKRMSSLVVGDDPSTAWGEDTLRRSTLDKAYGQLISSLDSTAQDHSSLSDDLISQVADAAKSLEKKHEDMKNKQFQFYQKLLSDRDKIYADRQKYDEECLEIESYRRKQDRSQDDKHASRAAKQYETQLVDMQNSKNIFVISTAISNRAKGRFYTEDLPLIEDTNLITGLVSILIHAQSLHTTHLSTLQSRVNAVQQTLTQVDPAPDQDLFIAYNTRPFSVPNDWGWEPCAGYYDSGEMVIEPAPKVFLQNKLSRCREKLQEVSALIDSKKRDVDKIRSVVSAHTKDRSLGTVEDVMNDYLGVQHQLTLLEFSATLLGSEIDTISDALGGDEGSQSPHSFKSTSFSIPTTCGYCKSSIWGLSKQGKTCKTCGLCVHAKCELKVPASCAGGGGKRVSRVSSGTYGSNLSRINSRASTISTSSTSTPSSSSFARPHTVPDESFAVAHVLYSFTPTSPFELAVTGGATVQVIEGDDGSGWIKVADTNGGKGLVPASYIEVVDDEASPEIPARAAQQTLGSGKYVRGLYTYQGQGADELKVEEGALIELSSGPNGGQNYADGWWEGYDKTGRKGIFPSNYTHGGISGRASLNI
ncbi:hypothetical protein DFH11DRAFT_1688953 [Phellopilus nigrolimitatus]|nr:hypothetical protein DFH11DRAFT_1688953 [Phellopilus nigrolimitatus]